MNFWMLIAIFFHTAGALAFGGGLLWFVLLLARSERVSSPDGIRAVDDNFRITGMGMSVGLTALIFGGLLRYYLVRGSFTWSLATPYDATNFLKIAVFFVEWVAWGWLEVVIMHPFRATPPGTSGPLPEAYLAARARVRRGLQLQLGLFTLVLALGALAQALR